MATLTNRQAMVISQHLAGDPAEGIERVFKQHLPVAGSMKLRSLANLLSVKLRDVEAERMRLIEMCAKKDDNDNCLSENGKYLFASAEDATAFNHAFDELMNLTFDCSIALTPADFGTTEPVGDFVLALGDLLPEPKGE